MTTPGNIESEPVIDDFGANGLAGVRISFDNDEYVIAQQLENGFGLTWTTEKDAAEAIADYTAMGTEGMSSNYLVDGEGQHSRDRSVGEAIVGDLQVIEGACIFAKLRKKDIGDHVVFNSSVVAEGPKNTVAILGPFLGLNEEERVIAIKTGVEASATPAVLSRVDWVLEQVIGKITGEPGNKALAEARAKVARMQEPGVMQAVHDAFDRKPADTSDRE